MLTKNFAYCALTANVSNSTTTFPVDETSRLPTNAQLAADTFYMTVESTYSAGAFEIVQVTAKSTTSGAGNLTVVRGADGSTAAAHTSGDIVKHSLTAGLIAQIQGAGFQQSFAGTASVGSSLEAFSTNRVYLKKITLAQAALISSVDVSIKDTGSGAVGAIHGVVHADSSGAPGKVIASGGGSDRVDSYALNSTAGWVSLPIGAFLPAGDYWIGFQSIDAGSFQVALETTGGADKYFDSGGAWIADASFYTVNSTTKNYSIRASTFALGSGPNVVTPYVAYSAATTGSSGTVPTSDTLVPGMSITLPPSMAGKTALVNAILAWTGSHTNRARIYLDGSIVYPAGTSGSDAMSAPGPSSSNTLYQLSANAVPVALPNDNSAHTIELRWQASDSTAAVTITNGSITAILAQTTPFVFDSSIDNLQAFTSAIGAPQISDEFSNTGSALPGGYSWVNQGGASYDERLGTGVITGTSQSGDQFRMLVRSLSGLSSTWTAYAKCAPAVGTANYTYGGIVLRESSSGKFYEWRILFSLGGQMGLHHWSSPSAFAADDIAVFTPSMPGRMYYKIKKNASTWDFYYSLDGRSWRSLTTGFTASYCTPDQIGFYTSANGGGDNEISVHWLRIV